MWVLILEVSVMVPMCVLLVLVIPMLLVLLVLDVQVTALLLNLFVLAEERPGYEVAVILLTLSTSCFHSLPASSRSRLFNLIR